MFVLNKLGLSFPKRFIPGKNGESVFKPNHRGADLEWPSEACGDSGTMPGGGVLPTMLQGGVRGGGVCAGGALPAVCTVSVLTGLFIQIK